jgi:hypothetical protein
VSEQEQPPQQQQPQVVQQVTVKPKRGCSICGCGCVIPAVFVPALTIAFWSSLGLAAVAVAVGASFASLHGISLLGRAVASGTQDS